MRQYSVACFVSAALGMLLAMWWSREYPGAEVRGQETRPRRAEARPASESEPGPRWATGDPRNAAADPELAEFTPAERVNIAVYERSNRGVVHITTRAWSPDTFFSIEGPTDGAGSGSVLDTLGHILTNYHVVEDANEIRVTLYNGETYEAGLVGRDPPNDIAILRISAPAQSLHPIELGDSSRLRVGQNVYAIGNPFGLDRTLTIGIISSLDRKLPSRAGRDMKSIIQIDAALNRGNSGGPLLSSQGVLIGMNTAIASATGENTGVGFAIPSNTIRRVVPQLIEHGRFIRPAIGIASVYETGQGLVVIQVVPGGPAERAGLRGGLVRKRIRRGPFTSETTYFDRNYGDVITAVDDKPVKTGDELLDIIEAKKPGERVVVRVRREGREVEVLVVLGAGE